MEDTKNFLLSKTVIGVVISFVGLVMGQFHLDATSLTGSEDIVVQLGGLILALYGRIKAVKKISVV